MYHTASVMYNSYNVGNSVKNVHVDGRGAIIGGYFSCSTVSNGNIYINACGYCYADSVSIFNQAINTNIGGTHSNNTERYIPFCNGFTIYSRINVFSRLGDYVNFKNAYGNAILNVVYYTVNS